MSDMNKYLVDVPVRINIWIRPECQKKQWDVVRQARPSIIFLQSDGGRNEEEWEAIYHNRKMIDESIDWECQVYRFYEDHNNGLYTMGKKVSDFIWTKVDRCIFTEDDQIMSVSFFQYCAELLEKYKDDTRIAGICGTNQLGLWQDVNSDYFFAKYGCIWGTATWKRVKEQHGSFDYYDDKYVLDLLKQKTKNCPDTWKKIVSYPTDKFYGGHTAGSEFWRELDTYVYNQLYIIPKCNMISNIGATDNATHAIDLEDMDKEMQQVFFTKTYEIDLPIRHPQYVIHDQKYDEAVIKLMHFHEPKIYGYIRFFFHSSFKQKRKAIVRFLKRGKRTIEK